MDVVVGELWQETNSFSPKPTSTSDFELTYDSEIRKRHTDTGQELGGVFDAADNSHQDVNLVPTVSARAVPGGPVEDDLFESFVDTFLRRVGEASPDGVLLCLHGAMVTETRSDPEGELLARVRDVIEDVPVVASLDHHANVTSTMVSHSDGLIAYTKHPHTAADVCTTARRAFHLLVDTVTGDVDPSMSLVKAPFLTTTRLETNRCPMREIFDYRESLERSNSEVVAVSACPVQPWLDVPEMAFSAVVVTDSSQETADSVADSLARRAWSLRDEFTESFPTVTEALNRATSTDRGPIVVSDRGDVTLGGAPGDSTVLLRELIERDDTVHLTAAVPIVDPVAVDSVDVAAATPQTVSVGGRITPEFTSVEITGTVETVTDEPLRLEGSYGGGSDLDMGTRLAFRLTDRDIWVILSEKPGVTTDPSFFSAHGVEPERSNLLVVKSIGTFRPNFEQVASEIVIVDTPGVCSVSLDGFEYRAARPIYPLDEVDPSFRIYHGHTG